MNRSAILAVGLTLLLAGCVDYLNNRDTVTFGAGDAKAANLAVHKVDPWSRHGYQTSIQSDGSAVLVQQRRSMVPTVSVAATE
jgi:hypothetical protein